MSESASLSSDALAGAPSSSYAKYASLPDVDTTAPDVYEYEGANRDSSRAGRQRSHRQRGDRDGQNSDSNSSSDDSERIANRKHAGEGKAGAGPDDIDSSSLRVNDAAAKFSGATHLEANSTDFSGRLQGKSRKTRKTEVTRRRDAGIETTTYALDGEVTRGEESVVDRLRRLKFEASQLEEELDAAAVSDRNTTAQGKTSTEQVDHAEVVSQLKVLQDQLARMPSPLASTTEEDKLDKESIRRLIQQIKQPSAVSSDAADAAVAPLTGTSASATSETRRTVDMAHLEARLSELESTLGLEEVLLDESKPVSRPVLPTLSRLEHQLSLLSQPRHLDAISRRVKVLVTEMDRVHDVRRKLGTTTTAGGDTLSAIEPSSTSTPALTPTDLTKLQHLFDVSTRLEPLLPVIPSVLSRLQTLSELHSSAAHFGSTLQELEEANEERQRQDHELNQLLQKMEVNMEQTQKTVEANLVSLQSRIEDVAARLDKVLH